MRSSTVNGKQQNTHKDLNYKPAKERARERNGVFKLLHILFREKRKQEENNFFKIVLLERRRKEQQISMNSRKKPTRETCWVRGRSERETRNAVRIECTSRFSQSVNVNSRVESSSRRVGLQNNNIHTFLTETKVGSLNRSSEAGSCK